MAKSQAERNTGIVLTVIGGVCAILFIVFSLLSYNKESDLGKFAGLAFLCFVLSIILLPIGIPKLL